MRQLHSSRHLHQEQKLSSVAQARIRLCTTCHSRTRTARNALCLASAAAEALRSTDASSSIATPSIKLFYRTGWDRAVLHGSLCGGAWQDHPLTKEPSTPDRWLVAQIPLPSSASSPDGSPASDSSPTSVGGNGRPLLEFVVADASKRDWDKPPEGANYQLSAPGVYSLRSGSLRRLGGRPVLLVSDLDGTMVGDDAATAAFRCWWEEEGALRGGVLAYNTGRSLPSFLELLRAKAGCMAAPDALILAVGTAVYLRNPSGGPADSPSGWLEDREWSAALSQGWNLKAVRDACYAALGEVGSESMHFRPPEEQNAHKVTCGVADAAAGRVVARVQRELAAAGVAANVITSGHGGWKYLDVVPARAGKLEALQHVRRHFGFSAASTVACGDSGNDILMLSGENIAIVVGNAQPDLRQWAQQRQAAEPPLPSGKHRLLMATRKEALGILEGLEHFGFKG